MLYILSKIFGFFIQPFNLILALALASVLVRKPYWKRKLRLVSLILFLIFSNGVLLNECLLLWEKKAIPVDNLAGDYEIAVVLGGTTDVDRDGKDRLLLHKGAERVTDAINLCHSGKVKKILFTGGNPRLFEDSNRDNSPIVDFYEMCGVAPEDILIESASRNTRENAFLVREMIEKNAPGGKVILITSAFHMRRSEACFRKVGIEVTGFSTDFYSALPKDRFGFNGIVPSPMVLAHWNFLIKEWIGYVSYWILGYI